MMKLSTSDNCTSTCSSSSSRVRFELKVWFIMIKVKTCNNINIYPLVTHDPNMLKKKSRGNLVGKIKVSLPERKYQNFC